jgi:tetratricopeptide (TPR) repeat protein
MTAPLRAAATKLIPTAVLLLCALPALAAPPGAAPASPPIDDSSHYQSCLDLARGTPGKGLAEAEDWRRASGGFPADHCAAVALFKLGRYAEAAQRFEALGGAMMDKTAALRAGAMEQAGQAWLLAGKAVFARADFDAALRYTPSAPDLFIDRAEADAELKDFAAAVADLDSALALAPQRADALVYRASAYRQLGRLDSARADIDAALKAAPDDPAGLLERGNIRGQQGDAVGARADWNAVVRLAPNTPAANAARGNIARAGQK